jgi:microcystin-dependent protein
MNDSQRNEAKESAGNGLLVYDANKNIYFFFNKQTEEWIALNPIQASDGNTSTLKLADGSSTITFENDVIVNKTLTVNGNTTLQNPVTINNTITANGNINAGAYSIDAGTVTATTVTATTINVGSGTTITTDKVKSVSFEGYGVTPVGGIIMWSGTTAPDGWVLCDGNLINDPQSTKNGSRSPDLKGRFIVGYSSSDADYNSVSKTGGAKQVILTGEQMPRHSHFSWVVRGADNEKESNNYLSSVNPLNSPDGLTEPPNTGGRTGFSGNNQPHENRPPYYVLAFIMRIK